MPIYTLGCTHCGDLEAPLSNYHESHPNVSEPPLWLCDRCASRASERANERAQGEAWAGGFARNH